MNRLLARVILIGIALSLGGCACRGGVGPYGGAHQRCWVW